VKESVKMKIVIFSSSYFPVLGGVQEVASRLAKEFKKKGHNVAVITQRYPRTLKKKEVIEDILVYRILFPTLILSDLESIVFFKYISGLLLVPLAFFRLLYLLQQERPDVVYLHFVGIGALYLLACRPFIPFKLIVTLHGDDVEGLPFRHRFHNRLLYIDIYIDAYIFIG
jgi:glycosyltransferase involved in cell wall biosynthesis